VREGGLREEGKGLREGERREEEVFE